MRVCFAVGAMNVGGVQTFIINLSLYLISIGHKVIVVTTSDKGEWWSLLAENGITGINLQQLAFSNPVISAIQFARLIREERIDVVFLNHSRPGQLAIPLYSDYCVTVPIIHNDVAGIISRALQNRQFVDGVVAVSPKLYACAMEFLETDKLVQINYPVAFPSESVYHSERQALGDTIKLLYVGRIIEEQKGVFLLPEILKECRRRQLNVSLTVVGGGEDMIPLRNSFCDLGLDDIVSFAGYQGRGEILSTMLKHHVLLMPSRYEGLGIVAVEAQGCGCVPIVSHLPGVTDHAVFDGYSGFLVKGRDCRSWVDYIEFLYYDKISWTRCSQYGRNHAKEKFSIGTVGNTYVLLFETSKKTRTQVSAAYRYAKFFDATRWRDWVPNLFRAVSSSFRSF